MPQLHFDASAMAAEFTAAMAHAVAPDAPAPDHTAGDAPTEIAFVDWRVVGQDALTVQRDGMLVVVLDANHDGVAQISETLSQYKDIKAVHVLAHGDAGEMFLGNSVLDAKAIADGKVAGWSDALTKDGDVLLYGCNVAEGAQGQTFVQQLAQATGADVGASTDATGSALQGGNWNLEYTVGALEASPLDLEDWGHLLVSVNATAGSDTLTQSSTTDNTIYSWTNSTLGGNDTISDSGGTDTVSFSGVTTALTFTIGNTGLISVSGTNVHVTVSSGTIESIIAGSGQNTFIFQSGGALGGTITGGAGLDTLDYSAYVSSVSVDLGGGSATGTTGISGIENVDGGSGADTLTGNAGGNIFRAGGGADTIAGGGGSDTLDYSTFSGNLTFTIGATAGTVNVTGLATAATGIENLIGGSGDDTFSFADGATLSGTIDGGGGTGNALDYSLYTTSVTVNPNAGSATGVGGGASGHVNNLQNVTGGSGSDTLDYAGDSSDLTFSITGASGTVTVIGSAASVSVSAFENLIGGSGDNTFTFANAATLGGTVDGGSGGINTISYAAYTASVTVDLAAGTATGTGGISNFQNITGGSGDDTITGDSNDNVLKGGSGNDIFKFADSWGTDTVSNAGGKVTLDFSLATASVIFTVTGTSTVSATDGSNALSAGNVWSITGGGGDDTFAYGRSSGSGIGGNFDGGAGTNTLDYSTLDDNLDLSGSTLNGGSLSVPGIGGTVSHIDQVQHPVTIITGVDAVFGKLESTFASLFGGVSLPLIGHLDSSVSGFLGDLKDKIDLALATQLLVTVGGPGSLDKKTDDLIHDAMAAGLNVELGPATINIAFKDLDSNGSFDAFELNMNLGATIWSDDIPIDFAAAVPGLGLSIDGDIHVELAYTFHFGVGIIFKNVGTGSVFKQGDYYLVTAGNEFVLSLSATLPADFDAIGTLGFLQLEFQEFAPDVDPSLKYFSTQTDTDGRSGITASFTVDVDDPNHDGLLTRTEINTPGFKFVDQVTAHANVSADVDLRAEVSIAGNAAIPHIMTIFHYSQTFANADISVAGGIQTSGPGKPTIIFEDVTLDLGTFLSDFLSPILTKIQQFTEPLQPIIDLLEQDIPIISDLPPLKDLLNKDGQNGVSLLDFAGTLLGDTKYAPVVTAINVLADLITMVNSIPTGDNILINFGTFTVAGGSTGVDATQAGALKNENSSGIAGASDTSAFDNQVNSDSDTDRSKFLKKLKAGASSAFSVPILTSPSAVLGLLMGQTVDLFKFELPDLTFSFDFRKSVTIVFPLNAVFFGGVDATIRFGVGFDTRGLQEFLTSGNAADILDGFYLDDHGNEGTSGDLPEVELHATIGAGASVGISGIVEAGVEAGITGTIDFDLNDVKTGPAGSAIGDGKVYFDDLSTLMQQAGPLGFINISGELDWFLDAFVWVGLDLGFFGKITLYDETFDLGSGVIVKFENHYDVTVPPDVADLTGGTLNLHMGLDAAARGSASGDTDGSKDEEFTVDHVANNHDALAPYSGHLVTDGSVTGATTDLLLVGYNGYYESFDASKVNKIYVADAGAGNDSVTIGDGVTANVEIHGGDGDDTITSSSTGTNLLYGDAGNDRLTVLAPSQPPAPAPGIPAGVAILHGGGGDDVLTSADANDFIYGDDGNDKIKSGDGNDWIEGGMESVAIAANGKANGDTIDAGKGDDVVYGGTATGSANFTTPPAPTAGGSGSDSIKGGDGNDRIFGGDETGALASGKLLGDTIDGGKGDDVIYGGGGADTIKGSDGNDAIYGGDGDDAITGGTGVDQIFGDGKNFATDGTARTGNDSINWTVGDSVDSTIDGGGGNDTLNVTGSNADTAITMSNSSGNVLLAWGANNLLLQSVEKFSLNGGTGADTFVINDLAGTGAKEISIATGGAITDVTQYDYNKDGTYGDNPPFLLDQGGNVIHDSAGNPLFADVYADGSPVPYKVVRQFAPDNSTDTVTINSGGSADQFTGQTHSDPVSPGSTVFNLSRTGTASISYSVAQSDAARDTFLLSTGGGNDSVDLSAVTTKVFSAVTIDTGAGNDTIFGTQFADTINSGDGDDRVSGNGGVDTFIDSSGKDVLSEANDGSPTFDSSSNGVTRTFFDLTNANFTLDGSNLTIAMGATVETENISAFEQVSLVAGTGANTFTVQNWAKTARLDGGSGSDTYNIHFLGSGSGSVTENDSIQSPGDVDQMFLYGTAVADLFSFTADNTTLPLTDGTVSVTHGPTGSETVETVNYTHSERLEVRGGNGDDTFVVDDNGLPLYVYGEAGSDHFLIGRVTASHVDPGTGAEIADAVTNGISAESFFFGDFGEQLQASGPHANDPRFPFIDPATGKTIEINVAQSGNDDFEVNHNLAPLWLFGNAGDDRFVVNAVLVQDASGTATNPNNLSGGSGANTITYLQNAPVNIDGGSGNDVVVVNGTGIADTFIIAVVDDGTGPQQKVIGAGLQINMKNVERLEVNGAGGDDVFYVYSTLPGLDVVISGGSGNDTIYVGAQKTAIVVDPPAYTVDPPAYTYDPPPFIEHWDSVTWSWGDFWYFDWSFPFWHYQPLVSYSWWYPVWVDPAPVVIDPPPMTVDPAPFQFSAGPTTVLTGIQGKLTIDGGALDSSGGSNDDDRIVVSDTHSTAGESNTADTLTFTSGDHDGLSTSPDVGYLTGAGMTQPDGAGGTTTGGFFYYNAEHLDVYLSDTTTAGDDVTIAYTDPDTTTSIFGGQGDDHFRVKAANGVVQLDGGAGNDSFDIWNDANLLTGITGTLRINGGGGTDSVDVRDTADTTGQTGMLTSSSLSGLDMTGSIQYGAFTTQTFNYSYLFQSVSGTPAVITTTHNAQTVTLSYAPIENLTVSLGSGDDLLNVTGTQAITTINANGGNDTINVSGDGAALSGSLDDVAATLNLHLGAGNNTLNVSDRGDSDPDAAVNVTSSAITGLAPAAINYDAVGGRFSGGVNIWTGQGNDGITLTSSLAGDAMTIDANAGNDTVTVSAGQAANLIVLRGGQGNDTLNAGATTTQPIVLIGDDGEEIYNSATKSYANLVTVSSLNAGLGGTDTLTGGAGVLVAIGGAGGDTLNGAGSNDLLIGDNGEVTLAGTIITRARSLHPAGAAGGADFLHGAGGNNILIGGLGGDTIDAAGGNDVAFGDNGDVTFDPAGVIDLAASTEVGQGGIDTINVGDGRNVVIGGASGDTITAGIGNDVIIGDNGNFDFTITAGTAVLTRAETVDDDTVLSGTGGDDIVVTGAGDNVVLAGQGSDHVNDSVTSPSSAPGAGNDVVLADDGFVTWTPAGVLTAFASTQLGQGGADVILVGDGRNIVVGGAGSDVITAGAGDDVLVGDNGVVTYTGGIVTQFKSTDVVAGTGGDDVLTGGGGRNLLLGGVGADGITAGIGDDVVLGDNGLVNFAAVTGIITDATVTEIGLGGIDTINVDAGNNVVLAGAGGDSVSALGGVDVIIGDSGSATWTSGVLTQIRSSDTSAGTGGDDTINAGAGRNYVVGGVGADGITTGADDDVALGDNGVVNFTTAGVISDATVTEVGLGGVDTINVDAGNNVVLAGAGGDNVIALGGMDVVIGDSGSATWAGGVLTQIKSSDTTANTGGDDSISVGDGRNFVVGGVGADSIATGSGDDVVLGDNGVVNFTSVGVITDASATDLGVGGADTVNAGGGNNVIMGGAAGDTVTTGPGDDTILGDNGNLTFTAGVLTEAVTTDTTNATGGDDVVVAGDGVNVVLGGVGNDTITTGSGNDVVIGDNGIAQFNGAGKLLLVQARDPLLAGDDSIDAGAGDDVVIGGSGSDSILGGAGNDVLIGDAGTATFSAGSLTQVVGDSAYGAADFISGGPGNDILLGGFGDDTLVANLTDDLFTGGNARISFAGGLVTTIEVIDGVDLVLQSLFDSFSAPRNEEVVVHENNPEAGGGVGGTGGAPTLSSFGTEGVFASDGTSVVPGLNSLTFSFGHGVPLSQIPELLRNIVLEMSLGAGDPPPAHGGETGGQGGGDGQGGGNPPSGGDAQAAETPALGAEPLLFAVEAEARTIAAVPAATQTEAHEPPLALAVAAAAFTGLASGSRTVQSFDPVTGRLAALGASAKPDRGILLNRAEFAARGIDW